MAWWRKKQVPPPPRKVMLAARPLRNPLVTERLLEDGSLELTATVAKGRLGRWLTRDAGPAERKFRLDKLGLAVWRMMDGKTPVLAMIERFATEHQLNLREAEVAMLAYLRTLAARGLMLLALPEAESAKAGKGDGGTEGGDDEDERPTVISKKAGGS